MIDQSLMSAFVVRYEVEVISIGKSDSKRAIEAVNMLRIRFKKVEKRIETEDEDKRGEGSPWNTPRDMTKESDVHEAEVTVAESWEYTQLRLYFRREVIS